MQIKSVPWMLLRRGGKKGISNNANGDLRCLMNKEKRLIGNNMSIVREKKAESNRTYPTGVLTPTMTSSTLAVQNQSHSANPLFECMNKVTTGSIFLLESMSL